MRRTFPYLAFVALVAMTLSSCETTSAVQPTAEKPEATQVMVATEALAEEPSSTDTPEPTEVPTNTPAPQPLALGDMFEQRGYLLSALVVEDPATRPGIFYESEAGKKLVAVEFIVGNVSGEQFSSNVLRTTMVDAEGFVYGAESGAVEGSLELLDVNPGEKVIGWAGFIVPEDSTPAILKYEFDHGDIILRVGLAEPEEAVEKPEFAYTPDPDLPKLGEVSEDSGYSLSALVVEDPATRPGIFYESEAGKKLVAVEFIVGNVSGEQFSSNVLRTTMVDAEGFVYGAESGAVEGSLELLDVNPGEKVIGWAGFIVPEDSTPAILKYEFDHGDIILRVRLTAE